MEGVKDFINKSISHQDLRLIQTLLSKRINKLSNPQSKQQAEEFVEHIPEFLKEALNNDTVQEGLAVTELEHDIKELVQLVDTSTGKRQSLFLNNINEKYEFNGSKDKPAIPLADFPAVNKMLDLVNNNEATTKDSDCCEVNMYFSGENGLGWHDDGEDQINQGSSISVLSYGVSRRLQFRSKSKRFTRHSIGEDNGILLDFTTKTGSLTIMKPGCQSSLVHRVPPNPNVTGVRISFSFRKYVPRKTSSIGVGPDSGTPGLADNGQRTEICSTNIGVGPDSGTPGLADNGLNVVVEQPKESAVLFVGDSWLSRLNTKRLAKGKNINIFNLSRGGSKIHHVRSQIEDFHKSKGSDYNVKKICVSVGTNDIRYAKHGVRHLTRPLDDLIKTIKDLFPTAIVWIQSIPPLPIVGTDSVGCVLTMNEMLFEACRTHNCYYIDMMSDFLVADNFGRLVRNEYLFMQNYTGDTINCHFNYRGIGILARKYIKRIHSNTFNPLAY